MKVMSEPRLYYYMHHMNIRFGEKSYLDGVSVSLLKELIAKLNNIDRNGNEYWYFWIKVPRGNIEDFGDYDALHEEGEYDSYEEYKQAWLEWFPEEEYWHEVYVGVYEDKVCLSLDNSRIINININEISRWGDYSDLLSFLIEEVDDIVKLLKLDKYNDFLNSSLPYCYREGFIPRALLWGINPKQKIDDLGSITAEEIKAFFEYNMADCLLVDNKPLKRLSTMTVQKYYEASALCYVAAGFKVSELSSQQMYKRFADGRDGGLTKINETSAEEFDGWFALDYSEKWKIENPTHLWEMVCGSTHTRIWLYVMKDELGYYFVLSGGVYCNTVKVVKMYLALKANDYPVYLCKHQLMAKKLEGIDNVGIVSCNDYPFSYWYGGFPVSDIVTFCSLDRKELSKQQIDKIVETATWFDLEKLELIK